MKDEFGRIATAFKSHESSRGGHKQHDPEMEKSIDFAGAVYDDIKGLYVAAKKDLKGLGEGLNTLSTLVDEMTIEFDNLVQHNYNFNVKLARVPEIAEPGSKESALDTTKLCVRIFEGMGLDIWINDIDRVHRVPAQNATNGPKPIICRLVRQLTREEVVSHRLKRCGLRRCGRFIEFHVATPPYASSPGASCGSKKKGYDINTLSYGCKFLSSIFDIRKTATLLK